MKQKQRTERDFIGEVRIPEDALFGIHSLRARENFPNHIGFHPEWFKAVGHVKLACYRTYGLFKKAALKEYGDQSPIRFFSDDIIQALEKSAEDISDNLYFEHFIVPAVQGGAGTSINMNVNEIIANRALQLLGNSAGEYHIIDPIEQANVFQSTNDVIPTALKVAVMHLLKKLEEAVNKSRKSCEQLEQRYQNLPAWPTPNCKKRFLLRMVACFPPLMMH